MAPNADSTATTDDSSQPNGDSAKEPAISRSSKPPVTNKVNGATSSAGGSHRKASAPIPSPVPTSWATNADMSRVRANTPLTAVPPPPPQPAFVPHPIEPAHRPTRSKSDASTKSTGKAGAFKRMFGGGVFIGGGSGGGGSLSNALPSPVDDGPGTGGLIQPMVKMALTPATPASPGSANGAHSQINGLHTPASERNEPLFGGTEGGQQRTPSRPSSVKGDSDNHRKPPSRAPSTDGRSLMDLLGTGPKLARKSSASSRKSDSSKGENDVPLHGGYTSGPESVGGGGGGRTKSRGPSSVGGDSATSLSKKYGVCEKAAIGKGATSVVRLAHKWDRKEEKLYAVKEFRKRRKNESEREYVKKLTSEFCISSTLRHPNVVETVDLVQDEHGAWCEVMEYCPGGDLYAAIKRGGMSPSEVECSFKQILLGLEYLHSQGVAHRDIKPENLFFDAKGQLKIGDYGASTVYRLPWETSVHMSTGLCGSEPYIAPEQFASNQPYDARLVDIWACGIVYYCLHFQELPWRVAQPTDPLFATYVASTESKRQAEAECPATINNLSPRACRPLLRRMLEPKPEKRILIEDVMRDKWIAGIEVCYLVEKPKHIHVHARQVTSGGVV